MRSLQGNLRPWCIDRVIARSIHQGWDLRFPCNDQMDDYCMMAFSYWIWTCNQLKPITRQWITLKYTSPQWVVHLSLHYSHVTLVSRYLLDSCQLTITWMSIRMSTIKLNTDRICLGHLASNARSLQENNATLVANQSACTVVAI